jgi:hypothetical protein
MSGHVGLDVGRRMLDRSFLEFSWLPRTRLASNGRDLHADARTFDFDLL